MIFFTQLNNDYTGSTRILRHSIDVASSNGVDFKIYVSSSCEAGQLSDFDAKIVRYWYRKSRYKILRYMFWIVSQFHLFMILLRDGRKYDDVVVYQNTLLTFGGALYARLFSVRCVCHIHELSLGWFGGVLKFLSDLGQPHYLFVSIAHRNLLAWDTAKASVIYNAVDPILSSAAKQHEKKLTLPIQVYFPSAPTRKKGFDTFVALARLLSAQPDIEFHWVANCSERDQAAAMTDYEVPSCVKVHSAVSDMRGTYEEAHVVLNLSDEHQWIETFGMTIIEAMAFGCIVFAPPAGGPLEIVSQGRDGFLVHGREIEKIAELLQSIATDPLQFEGMSRRAQSRSHEFSFRRYSSQILPLLK